MIIRNTLAEAMTVARSRGNRTVWLVLSLEGAVYFVFFSRQDILGLANSNARARVGINAQIRGEALPNVADGQLAYAALQPHALVAALNSGADAAGRHAEEAMIESWMQCATTFFQRRGRAPGRAEIFLSHSPCFPAAAQPSPARSLAGTLYPASCEDKLRAFTQAAPRNLIRWSVYYETAFGGRNFGQANFDDHNLRVRNIPAHIVLPG